jgi:hypothetical protein
MVNEISRVSATQVKNFTLCPRRWYIGDVLKERVPPTQSLIDGTEVHGEIEAYLPQGILRESKWKEHVALAAPYLPSSPVSPATHVEAWFEVLTYPGGPKWVGKIDVLDASQFTIGVFDHKTCKNFKYVLTEETLKTDVQMAAYGRYALTSDAFATKDRSKVKLIHTYIKIDGTPKIHPVSTEATKEEIAETWDRSLGLVREMQKVARLPVWQEVTPNTDACNAYGGCPYQQKCGFTNIVEQVKGGAMSSTLLDRLKAEQGNAAQVIGHDVPVSIVPPDAPSRSEAEPTAKKRAKKIAAPEQTTSAPVAPVVQREMEPEPAPPSIVPSKLPATFDLYVDCLPIFGVDDRPVMFETIVAPVAAKVADEAGVADARFVKYEAKPRLATHLRHELDKFPPVIIVSSMHTYADVFLEVAVPHARKYVRALRG